MPRIAALAFALALGPLSAPIPAQAQQAPPHAWLFGAWTGGLFPAPSQPTAQSCLAHPTVIFTQDIVLRASLTEVPYLQRQIETVRASGNVTEFRFQAAPAPAGGMLGVAAPVPAAGFGCEGPDLLGVQRLGPNQISFPGCADFPNPLVRCPAR